MNELLAYLMGMGRCCTCGGSIDTENDAVIVSGDDDNAVVWHWDCAPVPPIFKLHAQCREMARWN